MLDRGETGKMPELRDLSWDGGGHATDPGLWGEVRQWGVGTQVGPLPVQSGPWGAWGWVG